MKSQILYLLSIIFVIAISTSCNKDKPPVDMYKATFTGSYQDSPSVILKDRVEAVWIINSYSETIDMAFCSKCNTFSLAKGDNRSITGIIDISRYRAGYSTGPITINGKWSKKDGAYIISGNFSYIFKIIDEINYTVETFVVTGPFEIKPYYD